MSTRAPKIDPKIPAALAGVLDLDGQIPWDTTEFPSSLYRHQPPIGLVLRSTTTVGEMIAAMDDRARRDRKLEECRAYGTPLDEPYEMGWTVHRPEPASTFFGTMTYDQWVSYEASKMPAGYMPVRLDVEELRRRDFNSPRRDTAIREALDGGTSVATLQAETGLSRPRIYQIRDGK
jgi:hypothetical protein